MAADPPPADFAVSRADSIGGIATIYACRGHLAYTRQILLDNDQLTGPVTVGPANVDGDGSLLAILVHGCKGHLADWPVT